MNSIRRSLVFLCLFTLSFPAPTLARQTQSAPKKFELTIDSMMRGSDLVGYEPNRVYWSQDSRRVYFRWKRAGEARLKEPDLYVVERDGTGLRKLSEEEAKQAPPIGGDLSKDKKLSVFAEEGDIYIYDHLKGIRRRMTETVDGESNPRFSSDQKQILFTRQNNLYQMPLDGSSLVQLTDIRTGGSAPPETPPKGTESQEYLKQEERGLIEAVRERAQNREEQEAKRKSREKRKPFHLPAGQSVTNLGLSPDGIYVVTGVIQTQRDAKNTIVPNYVTESSYTEDIPSRSKVGDSQNRSRMVVLSVSTGESKWVEHGLKQPVPASKETQDSPQQNQSPARDREKDREVQLSNLQWSEDGKNAVIMARAADNKDRWTLLLDPATGKTRILTHLHDDAWVGGPGSNTHGWLPDNKTIFFQSERDGWSHLYSVTIDGGEAKQLISGKFEVSDISLSQDKTRFFFTSSEGSLFERHLYSMPISGGTRTRVTSMAGNNEATISPDETMLAIVRSYSNKPPELYLASSNPEVEVRQVTKSPIDEFFSHKWIDPPIVSFKARDGVEVPARLYKPADFKKGGPAVLFVHGAGYLQNVHKWWSNYYREYMFHHLLMENGFLVMDVDYRGSAGYGRDWRTAISRHMGGKDLSDHVDAVKYLIAEHGVDPKRVGLYGGS
ncbi:MAG: DPP IV N-terminal domain-containing protein [Acidobacteria bacterium]|nr:DPP IV N-terminal domain-containing protein [Acidobacteriota bacterium]